MIMQSGSSPLKRSAPPRSGGATDPGRFVLEAMEPQVVQHTVDLLFAAQSSANGRTPTVEAPLSRQTMPDAAIAPTVVTWR
ncbi:hypothetical protein [Streptomyces sp. NBC_00057]|uniref:hypothetical protein n=1 Tax=Streptomyces sp. NBC_00057 TaxID=2975634 RepID=UPI0032489AEF